MARIETAAPPPAPASVWLNFLGFLLPFLTAAIAGIILTRPMPGVPSSFEDVLVLAAIAPLLLGLPTAGIIAWRFPAPRYRQPAKWCVYGFITLLTITVPCLGIFMWLITLAIASHLRENERAARAMEAVAATRQASLDRWHDENSALGD
jgi:hypothetical protein